MPLEVGNLLFMAVLLGTLVVSLGLGMLALAAWSRGARLLRFVPRQPVPWGPIGLVVCSLLIGLQVTAWLATVAGEGAEFSREEFVPAAVGNMIVLAVVLVGGLLWVRVVHGATAADLGVVWRAAQIGRDLVLGLLACGLALAPVYAIQFMLVLVFHWEPSHDLFDALQDPESLTVIVVSVVAAVIAAPLFEEVYFRLFLQGWLERLEMENCGLRRRGRWRFAGDGLTSTEREPEEIGDAPPGVAEDPPPSTGWRLPSHSPDGSGLESPATAGSGNGNPFLAPAAESLPGQLAQPLTIPGYEEADLPATGLLGLPYGWFPILVSSALFALAHIGQGPSPIPLFFLALVLGYLYQRTHRIMPCIAMHFAFNSYSLVLLWLQGGPAA